MCALLKCPASTILSAASVVYLTRNESRAIASCFAFDPLRLRLDALFLSSAVTSARLLFVLLEGEQLLAFTSVFDFVVVLVSLEAAPVGEHSGVERLQDQESGQSAPRNQLAPGPHTTSVCGSAPGGSC